MPDIDAAEPQGPRQSVFLSYASEDRQAARALRDALPGYGLEVWYDESELGGGEAWDQKIRRQIRECDYFMPLVSAQTEARREGYFRREWRMAVERTLDMADDHPFLLPVVIDDTDQSAARVPEKFLTVQWLKVPGGQPTRALEALCRRIARGSFREQEPARKPTDRPNGGRSTGKPPLPPFPVNEPGQTLRFGGEVLAWAVHWAWARFQRLPRWIRIAAYVWLAIVLLSRCDSPKHRSTADVSQAKVDKLKAISENYQGGPKKADIAKLGAQIAKEFSDDPDDSEAPTPTGSPLLALAFTAPPGNTAAQKLADTAFAMAYGMVAISHRGSVGLTKDPLSSRELGSALERGKANHSTYVLWGDVDTAAGGQTLTVKIVKVADGSLVWSKSYASAAADPARIAADVDAHIPVLR